MKVMNILQWNHLSLIAKEAMLRKDPLVLDKILANEVMSPTKEYEGSMSNYIFLDRNEQYELLRKEPGLLEKLRKKESLKSESELDDSIPNFDNITLNDNSEISQADLDLIKTYKQVYKSLDKHKHGKRGNSGYGSAGAWKSGRRHK